MRDERSYLIHADNADDDVAPLNDPSDRDPACDPRAEHRPYEHGCARFLDIPAFDVLTLGHRADVARIDHERREFADDEPSKRREESGERPEDTPAQR